MSKINEQLCYKNTQYGITMFYPDNWVLNENVLNALVALTPRKSNQNGFTENIVINYHDLAARPMSLDMYINFNVNYLNSFLNNFEILVKEDFEVSGNPAKRVIYKGNYNDYNLGFLQIVTVLNMKAYALTYSTLQDTLEESTRDFYDIVGSFQIKSNGE